MSLFFWVQFLLRLPCWGAPARYTALPMVGGNFQVNKKLSTEVQEKVNKGPQPLNKTIHEPLE